jgi:DNA transposition AAA+ family ATPase
MSDATVQPAAEFLITKEYRLFAEFCDACRRERYIGLCYGPPGVGKTLSARHYTQWDLLEPVLRSQRRVDPALCEPAVANCRCLFYTPAVTVTPKQLEGDLQGLAWDLKLAVEGALNPEEGVPYGFKVATAPSRTELVLVDEADRLKFPTLEQLRDLYDRSACGVVLIGMPGLEKRLARYAQLYSRVGFVHQFRPLSPEELRFILERKWQQLGLTLSPDDFSDAEAMAAIARITGGNFRLLQRLFTQMERILRINQLHSVTKEVVEAARETLVIGPV